MHKKKWALWVLCLLLPWHSFAQEKESLRFALLVFNGQQRTAFYTLVNTFQQQYPHLAVDITAVESKVYKEQIESWLQAAAFSDVMYWFGGERLNWYVNQGWVQPIGDLWDQYGWDQKITKGAKSVVVFDNKPYALPIHYYPWGIYYKKSLFAQYGLKEPQTWEDLLAVSDTLKKNGITPFAMGSSEKWPLAGWFDYLNLRLNGLHFHRELLQGKVSYLDTRVRDVFQHWKILIERGYYYEDHAFATWRDVLPKLYWNKAAMFLMGNFWTSQIPEKVVADFSMFRFPRLRPQMPWYEEAPTNVVFIPKNAKNRKAAALFLNYLAQPTVQATLNEQVGMLAPSRHSVQKTDSFLQIGSQILKEAEGIAQFYDRDSPKATAHQGMDIFAEFVNNPANLEETLAALEAMRQQLIHPNN